MKTFPTPEPLFPSLLLSHEHAQRFAQLAHAVVHDTVAEYDDFVHRQQRKVSKRRWKRVKARENIAVYKERDHDAQANLHRGIASGLERATTLVSATRVNTSESPPGVSTQQQQQQEQLASSLSPSRAEAPPLTRVRAASAGATPSASSTASLLDHFPAHEYNLPKLLMVGTITGSLDDVLYGLSTHDSSSILLRSIYTQDEIVDGQVVHAFEGPTEADPYRFLGIKWIIKGHPPAVSAVVAPRDVLFLNAVGTLERADSSTATAAATTDRLGYFLMHSIDLPQAVPSLYRTHGIVRARLSTCHVFRQVRPGCVEVYMKGYAEPSGKVVESLALSSAVSGLLFCWKSVVCAQAKKLVWLLQHEQQTRARSRTSSTSASRRGDANAPTPQQRASSSSLPGACALCERSLSVFKSAVACELCDRTVCSRCRVAMKLCFETVGVKLVEQRSVVLCKCCITRAHRLDTRQVATDEVRTGRFGRTGVTTAAFVHDVDADTDADAESYSAPTSIVSDGSSSEPSSVVWDASQRLDAVTDSSSSSSAGPRKPTAAADVIDLLDRDVPICEWNSSVESPTASTLGGLESPVAHHSPPDRRMSPEVVELWSRMAALKVRQDDVYAFAKQNASLAEWSSGTTPVAPVLRMTDLGAPNAEQQQRESID